MNLVALTCKKVMLSFFVYKFKMVQNQVTFVGQKGKILLFRLSIAMLQKKEMTLQSRWIILKGLFL